MRKRGIILALALVACIIPCSPSPARDAVPTPRRTRRTLPKAAILPRSGRRSLNVKRRATCAREGCDKTPSYGDPKNKTATHCYEHRLSSHKVLYAWQCAEEGCTKRAYCGCPADRVPRTCKKHAEKNFVNLCTRHCGHPGGCTRRACYGSAKDRVPLFCAAHRSAKHVDVVNRLCAFEGCQARALYGNVEEEGRGPAVYCSKHKASDHFDVSSKACMFCTRRALYGAPEDGVARFCGKHRQETDVDNKNLKCVHPGGCTRQPSFGELGKKGRAGLMYCAEHREEHHVRNRPVQPKAARKAAVG